MGEWFDKYFSMNRKELQGLSFLVIVAIFLWFLPDVFTWLNPPNPDPHFDLRSKEILNFLEKNNSRENKKVWKEGISDLNRGKESNVKPQYFTFNPNTLTVNEGKRLGLSDYQIRMIRNYISKGGMFYKKEDFSKIYAITEEDYLRLLPYIDIPNQTNRYPSATEVTQQSFSAKKKTEKLYIELNSTDSLQLQELQGIGPVFASRVVRFRDLLGGFHDKSQLLNVYGMDEERYHSIENQVYTDSTKIKKININLADYQQLRKHPYINSKQANLIVAYRNQHGNYLKPDDLLKVAVLNEDFLRKIVPYLSFSND